jgi:hypothetical protein
MVQSGKICLLDNKTKLQETSSDHGTVAEHIEETLQATAEKSSDSTIMLEIFSIPTLRHQLQKVARGLKTD